MVESNPETPQKQPPIIIIIIIIISLFRSQQLYNISFIMNVTSIVMPFLCQEQD